MDKKLSCQKFSLVVDGNSLSYILEKFSKSFLEICLECEAVLCCRMAPRQKADVK